MVAVRLQRINKVNLWPRAVRHTCATCPHIDTFWWPDLATPGPWQRTPAPRPARLGQPPASFLQLQVPWRALFLFMLGRHKLTMLHHVQRTCGQTNYRATASPAGISKSTLSNAIKSCWTCRNINLTFYCPGRGPRERVSGKSTAQKINVKK